MLQLADRVRHVEKLKAEKARTSKYHKKKGSYVETNDSDQEFDIYEDNVAELKYGPPYTCKMLRPFDGKNPVKQKKMMNMSQDLYI